MRVLKFGGSDIKNRGDLKKILEILCSYDEPLIIVVSAVYGVTNRIIEALEDIKNLDIDQFLYELNNAYQSFLDGGSVDLEKRVYEIRDLLLGAKLIGRMPEFVYDGIVSHGERCSSLLLAKYLGDNGVECREAFPEDFGLITNGRFKNATVDLERSEQNIKGFFRDRCYVVPGFYGVYKGQRTLLGRGGSDYSATAIAFCVEAKSVDIYKDVPGFMTCDPKFVKDAKPVKRLNYDEAAELSYFGAKVLHHSAINPLRRKKIPLRMYNINSFSSVDAPDTVISSEGAYDERVIKSISFSDDIAIIRFKGADVGRATGLLGQITSGLGSREINIRSVITSQTCINILISNKDVESCREITERMHLPEVESLYYITDVSLIAAVGSGLLEKEGISAEIFSALSREGINVEMIAAGASEVTMYLIVDGRDRESALQAIHRELFGAEL